jgi:hypothetical protein
MKRLTVAMMAMIAVATAANATTMFPIERTCPVGGEKYQSFEIASTSQFGMRLDLRPNGPAAHLPWVECPNGFVVWKDEKEFTREEIAKLTPIVASAEYQRMRREHVVAYRVVSMRRALGESDADLAWLLLKAAWEAEDARKEELRQLYLSEAHSAFVARATAKRSHDEEWWSCSIVAAEIDRQRGRFGESIAALEALPGGELKADDPKLTVIAQVKDLARKGDAKPADFRAPGGPLD